MFNFLESKLYENKTFSFKTIDMHNALYDYNFNMY